MLAALSTPYSLGVYRQNNRGQGAALNRGVQAASGRFCLLLDDDIIADPQLVAAHLKAQGTHGGIIGLGQLTLRLPDEADSLTRSFASWWRDHYDRLNEGMRLPSFMDCYSGNLSVPRMALLEAGGFAVDLPRSYDIELGYRLERLGLSLLYIPEAIGQQDYGKGAREIMADAEKAGVAGVELYRRYPSLLPSLRLGRFNSATLREILLRRLLLAIGIPSRPLAMFGRLLGKKFRTRAWYPFVDRYCYWRGVRRAVPDADTWHRLTRGPIFLMYHAFGGPRESPTRYIIPARRFARQMAWLKRRHYHVISLEEYLQYRREHRLPPASAVVLTLDDGYTDNRTIAYPILCRYGFPATIFLVSGAIGGTNQWDTHGELAGRSVLSWSEIQAMQQGGMHFGAHTRTHVLLTAAPPTQVEDEVTGSRQDLEAHLGRRVLVFAYPYGKSDATSQATAEHAGFIGACSTHSGLNDPATPLYKLRRVEIRGTDSWVRFVLTLWLGRSRMSWRRWRRPA